MLFTKGAESAVLPFATSGEIEKTRLHVDEFALVRLLSFSLQKYSTDVWFPSHQAHQFTAHINTSSAQFLFHIHHFGLRLHLLLILFWTIKVKELSVSSLHTSAAHYYLI